MNKNTEYGLVSSIKDEKLIVKNLNGFLEQYHRQFAKIKSKDFLEARLPFIYKYVYFNLNKGMGTYMELYPNHDSEGKYKYPENENMGWILKVRMLTHLPGYEKNKTEAYVQRTLEAIGFDFVTLYATDIDD